MDLPQIYSVFPSSQIVPIQVCKELTFEVLRTDKNRDSNELVPRRKSFKFARRKYARVKRLTSNDQAIM